MNENAKQVKDTIENLLDNNDINSISDGINITFWQTDGNYTHMFVEDGKMYVLEEAGLMVYKNKSSIISTINLGINNLLQKMQWNATHRHKTKNKKADIVIEDLDGYYCCSTFHNLPYLMLIDTDNNKSYYHHFKPKGKRFRALEPY